MLLLLVYKGAANDDLVCLCLYVCTRMQPWVKPWKNSSNVNHHVMPAGAKTITLGGRRWKNNAVHTIVHTHTHTHTHTHIRKHVTLN